MKWLTNDCFSWDECSPLHQNYVVGKNGNWVRVYTGKPFDPNKGKFDQELEQKLNAFGVYIKDSEYDLVDHEKPYIFIDAITMPHAKELTPEVLKELQEETEPYEADFRSIKVSSHIVCWAKKDDV